MHRDSPQLFRDVPLDPEVNLGDGDVGVVELLQRDEAAVMRVTVLAPALSRFALYSSLMIGWENVPGKHGQ